MKYIPFLLLAPALLLGASSCGTKDGDTVNAQAPQSHPVYLSSDLGQIVVLGAFVEARARFTMNDDEFLLAVHVEADYAPAAGNTAQATAELALYDTKGDGDASNDVLIGQLSPSSPWSRGRLEADTPGSFSILCPLGAGTSEKVGPRVSTLGVRLRINTSSWNGVVTSWRLRIVTLKGAADQDAALSFVRDQ